MVANTNSFQTQQSHPNTRDDFHRQRECTFIYEIKRFLGLVVLAGPGHNGGDALVVGRELHFRGYNVWIYQPFGQLKELTNQHFSLCPKFRNSLFFSTS